MRLMPENDKSIEGGSAPVKRVPLPSPPGRYSLRYLTDKGEYLGEIEFFAVNQVAAKIMIRDLNAMLTGIVLAG